MADTNLCLSISDINVSVPHAPIRADAVIGGRPYGGLSGGPALARTADMQGLPDEPAVIEEDIAAMAAAEFHFRAAS